MPLWVLEQQYIWQGTAFQRSRSDDKNYSTTQSFWRITWTCNNGAILVRAFGVVNNSYISQLNVSIIRSIQIIVLAIGKQEQIQCHTANV